MLQTDLDLEFIDDIQDAANRVDGATEAGLDAAADVFFDTKIENVERTYQRPIPRGQNGRPRWKRTGKWKAGQRIRKSRFKRAITTIGAAAKAITNNAGGYEERLGKLNSERRNEAAQDTRNQSGDEAQEAFTKAFNKKMNL